MLISVRRFVWLTVPAVLAVYFVTRAPDVGLIDSGELAAGCHLLNILHPTGYPLYTLLGRLASLVLPGSVFNRLANMSVLFGAAGVGLFLFLLRRMKLGVAAAGATALAVGFSLPVWSVSVDVEVYALTFVLVVLLWLAVERSDDNRWLLLAAYLAGLALANHMSAASVVAGALIAVLYGRGRAGVRLLPVLLLLFLLGLSPYLFLLLRARAGPLLAWGNPVNPERLWWHVTGKQYQVWMFSQSMSEVAANAGRGLALLARSLGYVTVPLVFYGAWRLWHRRRGLALGLAATAVLCFAYAVNYSIPDIEAYFIPCLVSLAVFAAVGIDGLVRLGRWRHVAWAVPVVVFALNFGAANRRDNHVAYDGARNVLASAGENAIILTDFWDICSPVFYLQHVEGVRPDVCIIDKELVRRSWYFEHLRRAYPWLTGRSQPEIEHYLKYLDRFEHGTLKDPAAIQRAFINLLESFVTRNPERPAYTTFARQDNRDAVEMFRARSWVPAGVLYELRTDSVLPAFDYSTLTVRVPARPDPRTRVNLARYGRFAREYGALLVRRGRTEEARQVRDWLQGVISRN